MAPDDRNLRKLFVIGDEVDSEPWIRIPAAQTAYVPKRGP